MTGSREQALAGVAQMVREQGFSLDGLTAQEAAARAWRRGGPTIEELIQLAIARGCRDASSPDASHTVHTRDLEAANGGGPESPRSA